MAAELVATMALETLRDLLVEEAKFLSSVSGQVEDVQRQLRTMHCFFKDADKKDGGPSSHAARNWVMELRDLANQAENVLERHAIEVASRREGKNLKMILKRFTCILCELSSLHEIGEETNHIRARMTEITNSLGPAVTESGGTSSPSNSVDHQLIRRTYGLHDEVQQHFVGMEKDIELLESLITTSEIRLDNNGGSNCSVISICGMGGLGKTTLATKIYNMKDVKGCFESRAWVCISQQLKLESVLRGLLKQLQPGWMDPQANEDDLVRDLHRVLTEKKCLVVLDDIWEVDHWYILRRVFPLSEGRHCKVLLTSRNERVAADIGYIHKLMHLNDDEGWELLHKIALPINHHSQPGLNESECKLMEDKGREIVKKCGYLPLAISAVGGILKDKKTPIEWEKVKRNVDSYLQRGNGREEDTRIKQILDLSYNVLPYNLKSCFLYLGCFREDTDIDAEQLYLLWVAEGMISTEDKGRGETMRDVAERYLYEMANRCMVQVKVGEQPMNNRFASCRLHDLMRDLCLSKGKQEQFLEVVDTPARTASVSSIGTSIRRLAFHGDKFDCLQLRPTVGSNHKLRSLLVVGDTEDIMYEHTVLITLKDFGKFKSLKILILERCSFKKGKLPKGIEKLILLKHLSLRESSVNALPRSLRKLRYLQSLDLRTFDLELPDNIIPHMERLRHLALPYSIKIGPFFRKLKLGGLSELETLLIFNSNFFEATDLLKMQNLQRFSGRFYDEESLSLIVHHISDLQDQFRDTDFSVTLDDIDWTVFTKLLMLHSLTELHIRGRARRLPTYEPQLCPNLVRLVLIHSEMEEDPMETLEKLPRLEVLELYINSFVGRKMVCRAGGFPQLRSLALYDFPNLVEWRVEEKAMPKLSYMHIHECSKLEMLPDGLRFITSLQTLSITSMPEEFNNRLKQVDGEAEVQGDGYEDEYEDG